ncbi:MAG: heat-inducible transcriptional repressor HrcA, partial [Anaeroplasmataceae bacterium]
MLTDRQKLILKAIIEEYIETNEPVGSKVLTSKPYLQFSSATIRYDMQHLEETGFLEKTHTSSGRIPAVKGIKYYVEHLITRDDEMLAPFDKMIDIFNNHDLSREEAMKKIVEFMSEYTGYYVAVNGVSVNFATVKKLELIPLELNETILLIFTSDGQVQSQRITIPDNYKVDDLLRIIDIFDNAMYGRSIYEIKEVLSNEARKPKIRKIVDFHDDI